jgi:hypothetical protein
MIKLTLLVIFCVISINCYCCNDEDTLKVKKNSIYIELGGKGIGYSLNYGRTIPLFRDIEAEIGIGYTQAKSTGFITMHLQMLSPEIILLFGSPNKLEVGYSSVLASFGDGYEHFLNSTRIGYRYQKNEGGFLFRASYCRITAFDPMFYNNKATLNWVGISFGYVF